MSKIKKENIKVQKGKNEGAFDENFAYKSVIHSVIFAGFFLIMSILINGEIITFLPSYNSILYISEIILRVVIILLFFLFMMISIGNYKELSGKPIDYKMVMLLFILSVAQGFRNPIVFVFSFVGVSLLLIYMYLIQGD